LNKLVSISIIVLGFIVGTQAALVAGELTEIRLVNTIDESRGYCLDIAGGRGKDAPLDRGLQAHTCYDYTGSLLEDQSFDSLLIDKGEFKIPYFDVCMTASEIKKDSSIVLASCENTNKQVFSLKTNGNIVIKSDPSLCVTVNSTEKREGRGATPVHVMRPLSLQECSDDKKAYQTWDKFSL